MQKLVSQFSPDIHDQLRQSAPAEDNGAPLDGSVRAFLGSGGLDIENPVALARMLVAVAEANLPVARIVEGHVNALCLLQLHAPDIRIGPGLILGVWGADGDDPARVEGAALAGTKRYASGLGLVTDALVTVGSGDAVRLALVDVRDPRRHRPGTWTMQGMRATVSGDVDLDGLAPRWIGGPGVYLVEPTFLGGTWRIAALQLGGTLGLLAAARDHLGRLGRLDADAQIARLAPITGRAMAAFGLVERAAALAQGPEGQGDPDRAVALSLMARLLTEDLAQDAIAAVERSIGLVHFSDTSESGRIARDLATYCRQAARDAMEQRAARTVLARGGPLSEVWHG